MSLYRMYFLTSLCNISLKYILYCSSWSPLVYDLLHDVEIISHCTYIQMYGAIDVFVLGTMKVVLQDQYNCPQIYGVNQVMYVHIRSTGGNDSITKLHTNSHQQTIDQCTATQTRVTLTDLCQSVNTALANYNLL